MTTKTQVKVEDIAQAILDSRPFDARQLTHDFWAETASFSLVSKPATDSFVVLAISAALIELFAQRRGEIPPAWAAQIGGVEAPLFLVPEFEHEPYQRDRCLRTSPRPLKSRNLFAPDNYLAFV